VIHPEENSEIFTSLLNSNDIKHTPVSLSPLKRNILGLFAYMYYFIPDILSIYKLLKKNKCDVVYLSGGSWQFKGLIAGILLKLPVVWHLNDTSAPLMVRFSFLFFALFTNKYTFASEKTKNYYSKYIYRKNYVPSKLQVLRQPISKPFFERELSKKGKNTGDKFLIGTVANLSPVKDIEMFLRVVREINLNCKEITFSIAGAILSSQESYISKLNKYIEENNLKEIVRFEGYNEDVIAYLDSLDIFLCTSLSESGPMSVFEAMAREKPVICTNVGDLDKVIINGVNGDIVNIGDSKKMSRKIKNLINNKDLLESYGKAARNSIKSFSSSSDIVSNYKELFKIL